MDRRDAFERIVELLNEAMLDDARWPGASAFIDEAVGATGNVLTFGDGLPKDDIRIFFTKCCYRGVDRSAWLQQYLRDYHAEDEHLPRMRALPDSRIVPVADLFTEEERRTSLAYNEALVRTHGQKGLTMRLDGPGGSRIVWGIADPVDGNSWSSSQIETVGRVLPHLRQYVRVRSALVDAGALGKSVTELLGNARTGVIQLDRGGRVVEANDRALELLRRRDGLSDRHGTLRAASPEDDRGLRELLSRALPRFPGPCASGSMMVRRPSPAAEARGAREARDQRGGGSSVPAGGGARAGRRSGGPRAGRPRSRAGRTRTDAGPGRDRGAARRGPHAPPDRGGHGAPLQHGPHAPEAYLRQTRGLASARGGPARARALEPAGAPGAGCRPRLDAPVVG